MYGGPVSTEGEQPLSKRLDAKSLRGLAHPTRVQLLGLLRADGPATATGLAKRIGENSGTTSWHLRQLAEHGFIQEDTERGNNRERWWRAVHESTELRVGDFLGNAEMRGPLSAYLHEVVDTAYRLASTFVAEDWPAEWMSAASLSDMELLLSADELTAMRDEIFEVVRRYRRDERVGDEQIVVQFQAFPRRRRAEEG